MQLPNLPIVPFLGEICSELKKSESHFLVLTAETAAGKSTAVPVALLKSFSKKIIMLEPRRIATISIATRISEILGEEVGKTVGYRMYLESNCSKETRLEIVTEAILTKKIQSDPSLEDVSVVILDEFHERSINADFALALLKETMEIRDDLFVIVMSATIETKKLSEYLGSKENPCPVLKIPGRKFPVQIEYKENVLPAKAIFEQEKLLENANETQTILVFLPGIAEIRKVQAELLKYNIPNEKCEVLVLHSSISFSEQKKVISPAPKDKTRIILSSAIAETSITIPNVKTVIDSGFSRINKMNVALGMEHLVTEKESVFSAEQRAGRAGRIAPGKCIRLWSKNDVLSQNVQPEILRTDITSLVLECALWGANSLEKLNWLTSPTFAAWNEAVNLLKNLNCLSENCKITEIGKAVLKIGLSPRLSICVLCGKPELALEFSNYSKMSQEIQKKFLNDINKRLNSLPKDVKINLKSKESALLFAFPDRVARKTEQKGFYQFPSGRIAHLKKDFIEKNAILPNWIVAPEVDSGTTEGIIYSFLQISEEEAEEFFKNRVQTKIEFSFENNKLLKNELTVYGKIVISSKKLQPLPEDFADAICVQVEQKGLETLPLSKEAKSLLVRAEFYAQQKNVENKAEKQNLEKNVKEWLLPFLSGKTIVQEKTVYEALYWFLDGQVIDKEVPSQIQLENGRKCKVLYEKQQNQNVKTVIRPVLEIIIQQIFGCFKTPKVLEMPVLLKLLSPARRPLQITDDLGNFWNTTWPEICKEMKGRYPKHNWNYRVVCD